ncbi:alpha/beta hydrolase [Flavobacterium nackdongense]|uniref:Alpha/beta hydrolase n=1 Tax=Flavobacterium nackdongense TaxID=2547394 RepID=A0A4P6YIK3_9FLAO|nr:alpha/beta hydrolase [Flavobacterium nackdongense]QBN20313.1 alpha/beta hydrolase [Flavobacterium nackdongense]
MKKNFSIKTLLLLTLFFGVTDFLQAQNEVLPLWNGEIPGAISNKEYKEETEIKGGLVEFYSKVSVPTLTVCKPEKPNGTAVVIYPGGAYLRLYMIGEGYKIAKWLNSQGITAFILKYRLPSDEIMKDKTIGPLQDAQESIRFIRRNAAQWGINAQKVGVIGFSAGGHLASTLSTHYNYELYKVKDAISARPDFSILVYPVISMDETITHKGSRTNLLGIKPAQELIEKYSNEKHIDAVTPPTYIVHAFDDTSVVIENSIQYFLALRKNKVPSEIHLFQTGKHGFGMGRPATTSQNWTKQCEDWLKINQFITVENPTKN